MMERIKVGGNILPIMNFAFQQNYIPMVRNLIFTNPGAETLRDLRLQISFEPAFAQAFSCPIGDLLPDTPVEITPVRIIPVTDFFLGLTEKTIGSMCIEVWAGSEQIFRRVDTIDLLAYDEWPGISILPEMISAYVTPNHPKIAEILSSAGRFLTKWHGQPSFTGYQSGNPNTVKSQMAAIYAALREAEIAYTMPPPSYEKTGQRIRFPGAILEQRMGTCIDLTVLYAACLEAAGLHPVIIVIQGHAFCGCWLEEQSFGECVQDDVSAIRKRTADGVDEICTVECTCFTAGSKVSFDEAVQSGSERLSAQRENFLLAVDIMRSRAGGIRPAPLRISENGMFKAVEVDKPRFSRTPDAPSKLADAVKIRTDNPETMTKRKLWERRLLDLSLRNMLLSFRVTKNTIQLMASDLMTLEDALADGEQFRILPKLIDWENSLRDSKIFSVEHNKDAVEQLVKAEFQNKRIRTFLDEVDLADNLKNLYRNAKVSLEENGSNTLYLALGLLRWYESDISEKVRYAPLVLIPVELARKMGAGEYVLRIRDEEARMNITLLEYLRQDFGMQIGGLDPLPADESGIDLRYVFAAVRQAIMNKKRWDVEELAFLGLFSFNQFIMWNDIRSRSEDLEKNKIVRSLVSGQMEWQISEDEVIGMDAAGDNGAQEISPETMAVPLSFDSSQLTAVHKAARGQSFVLHGPPGTGKSQTITNIIANALFNGQSVLFVAQKMAALSVVQKRLEKIGLAPFILELHSNKARKRDVLQQLERTLAVGKLKAPENYAKTAEELAKVRKSLNQTVEELHRRQHYGVSLYEAIAGYEETKEYKGRLLFTADQIRAMQPDTYGRWLDVIRRIVVAIGDCGSPYQHPLSLFEDREYSLRKREDLGVKIPEFRGLIYAVQDAYETACEILHIPAEDLCARMNEISGVVRVFIEGASDPGYIVSHPDFLGTENTVKGTLETLGQIQKVESDLSGIFHPSVYGYDAQNALLRYRTAAQKWFLPRSMAQKAIFKELQVHGKIPGQPDKAQTEKYLQVLAQLQEQKAGVQSRDAVMVSVFRHLWQGLASDTALLRRLHDHAGVLYRAMAQVAGGLSSRDLLMRVGELSGQLTSEDEGALRGFLSRFGSFSESIAHLCQNYKIRIDKTYAWSSWLHHLMVQTEIWEQNISGLREWTSFLLLEDEGEQCGLKHLLDGLRTGEIGVSELADVMTCNVFYGCISETVQDSPALSGFRGSGFEEQIRRFIQLNEDFTRVTMRELAAKLSAKIPSTSMGAANASELGILQRAIKSGGRMMPVRKLFDNIPNLLRRLCPCMLMSPISVAQYVDPSFPKFDLVVFDEASQIPTCEAVGALARGDNAIVVGDPKQLPPTSFFNSNRVDEENFEMEDLESLLDDCLALTMPQLHLLWHYRSRHESLIAFSNQKYYENKLFTFPSPRDRVSEVVFVPVDGEYDRGATKQNKEEAKQIVAEICRRLEDPTLRTDSMGVVTFSSVQQLLIDDMLAEAFRAKPELEEINNAAAEPVFVKNLENVQGDERDVILFSIGYGPDKQGHVAMNFGPLNREGGWRRLNVAISRARKRMMIFSTLRPEQIDLARTSAEGPAGLKGFLEYALYGKSYLPQNKEYIVDRQEDPLEQEIAKEIEALGYQTACNIGCSGYKVDIGVVDPDNPDTYLMGILCDGPGYKSAKTAEDRNIVQPSVLASLGWNLHRVWALDWMDNPGRETEKIWQALIGFKSRKKDDQNGTDHGAGGSDSSAQKSVGEKNAYTVGNVSFEREEEMSKADFGRVLYPQVRDSALYSAEEFYLPQTLKKIEKRIVSVVEAEGPISRSLLTKRVLTTWGISKAGQNIQRIIDRALENSGLLKTQSGSVEFFWHAHQNPDLYSIYRAPGEEVDKRNMEDICDEEISNAVFSVMQTQISLSPSDLIREVGKEFGFARSGAVVETSVMRGLEKACRRGTVTLSEDREKVIVV